jgi:hypothetical protein
MRANARERVYFFSDEKPNSQATASLWIRETTDSSWIWVIFSLAGNGLFFYLTQIFRARELVRLEKMNKWIILLTR